MKKNLLFLLFVVAMTMLSCNKPKGYGDLDIQVSYTANGQPLVTDTLAYNNEAGNLFLVTEIQWFLSKVTLQDEEGNTFTLTHRTTGSPFSTQQDRIFYIDTNLPESQTLEIASLPCGHYTSLSFTFGLDQDDNLTGLFPNPPESNMFWPDPLGGGYHYMKLNGKYLDQSQNLAPLNIHLGIGQNEGLTQFYPNHFQVELPIDFILEENNTNQLCLNMNIDNWFKGPHVYDFFTYGSAIMQNQQAQEILKENGNDVFSVTTNNSMNTFSEITRKIIRMSAPKPQSEVWKTFLKTFSEITKPTENP